MDDFQNILENGINFGRGGDKPKDDGKVKTKAKKKQYITGAHGSGISRAPMAAAVPARRRSTVSNAPIVIRNK